MYDDPRFPYAALAASLFWRDSTTVLPLFSIQGVLCLTPEKNV